MGRPKKIKVSVKLPLTMVWQHQPLDSKKYTGGAELPIMFPPSIEQDALAATLASESLQPASDSEWEAETEYKPKLFNNDEIKENEEKLNEKKDSRGAARRVTAELDTDDEIIVRMKREKNTDREIAKYLKDTGRVNYSYKTIGSRWRRIREAQALAKDKALDGSNLPWKMAYDKALLKAEQVADRIVSNMIRNAENDRWNIVARKIWESDPEACYSSKACRERFEVLKDTNVTLQDIDMDSSDDEDPQSDAVIATPKDDLERISRLTFRSQIFTEAEKLTALGPLPGYKPLDKMTRYEIREELRKRGLQTSGDKTTMESRLRAARAGAPDLKLSNKPGDAAWLLASRDGQSKDPSRASVSLADRPPSPPVKLTLNPLKRASLTTGLAKSSRFSKSARALNSASVPTGASRSSSAATQVDAETSETDEVEPTVRFAGSRVPYADRIKRRIRNYKAKHALEVPATESFIAALPSNPTFDAVPRVSVSKPTDATRQRSPSSATVRVHVGRNRRDSMSTTRAAETLWSLAYENRGPRPSASAEYIDMDISRAVSPLAAHHSAPCLPENEWEDGSGDEAKDEFMMDLKEAHLLDIKREASSDEEHGHS